MFTIRKATLEDASAIATVHVAAWKETYRGIVSDYVLNNLSIKRRTEQWVNSLSDETHQFHRAFVAEIEGQVVGFASYGSPQIKDSDFDGELFAIYILKTAHRRGIGRALAREVVNAMREAGWNSMMVWVLKDNPARGFYERLGGEYLYDKPIEIGDESLVECAYGWRELSCFQGR
jgi:ribosomal protein S18 acetylase RimI-like enzyme